MRLPKRVPNWECVLRRAVTAEAGSGIGLIACMRLRTAEAQFRLGFDSQPLTVSANCADVIWGASDGSWLSFLLIDGSTYSYPADTSDRRACAATGRACTSLRSDADGRIYDRMALQGADGISNHVL